MESGISSTSLPTRLFFSFAVRCFLTEKELLKEEAFVYYQPLRGPRNRLWVSAYERGVSSTSNFYLIEGANWWERGVNDSVISS